MDESKVRTGSSGYKGPYYYTIRYGLLGAAAGLILPFAATVIVIWGAGLPLSLRSVIFVQLNEPLLWIIDTVPIFLGLLGALGGWREDQFRQSTEHYQAMVGTLEKSVDDRTHELERAVEVGHSVTLVSDLETMLSQAVELIRSSFNLYYVQVYLLDETGRDLIPEAGTGAAGSALASRSQRILLGPDSIVSESAFEKQTVLIAKTADDSRYQPNPLLPNTTSQVAMPLIIGNRLVGVLDLRSDKADILTTGSLPALETVAGQLAVAIEHARLVDETTTARTEIEEEARLMAHQGWEDFLNAIDRSELLGYSYNEEGISPVNEPLEADDKGSTLSVPIVVSGQPVGTIQVQGEDSRNWSAADAELATATARQIGQQVESLRLLAEAERYRTEAEDATRRLTREGWDAYLQSREKHIEGFAYDLSQVKPLTTESDGDGDDSVLVQTLTVRGETIGHLEVVQATDSDEETAELITAVAAQLSTHLENLRLAEQTEVALAETEEQARRLAALNDLGQALASAATFEDVFSITAQEMGQIVVADRTSIAILGSAGDKFEIFALEGEKGASRVGEMLDVEGSALGTAVREERLVTVTEKDDGEGPGITSFLVAPLTAGGRTFGTLNAGVRAPGTFGPQDTGLLQQVASLLAATMESRRLFSETERRAEELAAINRMAQAVSQQLELERLLETVHEQIQRVLQVDGFRIGFYDPVSDLVDYPIIYEGEARRQEIGMALEAESDSVSVLRTGEPLLHNLAEGEIEVATEGREALAAGEAKDSIPLSHIHVPLRTGRRTTGILSVESFQRDAYRQSDLALLDGIGNYVAVALDNARLYEQTRIRAEELAILNDMGRALTAQVDVESLTESVYEHTARLVDASSFCIVMKDPEKDDLADLFVREFGQEKELDESTLRIAEHVMESRQPLLIEENVRARIAELGITYDGRIGESWLSVPLITGEEVNGVIAVQSFAMKRAYDEHDRDLLTAVAGQAAIAIENARLFEQVQERARREQILREVTANVRGTADVDTIMRKAAQEVSRALGRQSFVYLDDGDEEQSTKSAEES
jgi:GAF domain-containing protein